MEKTENELVWYNQFHIHYDKQQLRSLSRMIITFLDTKLWFDKTVEAENKLLLHSGIENIIHRTVELLMEIR